MTAEPVFVLSDPLRHGVLRAAGSAKDGAVTTAATVMVERLMKRRRYAEAAGVALLGRRLRSASQALRYAAARGDIAFTDLFTHELEGVSYRDALADPFLAVGVALSGRGRIVDSARDELLARGIADLATLGDDDELDLVASESTAAEAEFERNLWKAAIGLIALRALGDWRGLADATRTAVATVADAPKSVLGRVGALRSLLAAQIESASALLGEPAYRSADRHRRLATALCATDRTWVLGSVALAAAIRGELAEAKAVLRTIEPGDRAVGHLAPFAAEQLGAVALVALEGRDGERLHRALTELSRSHLSDSGLHDLRTVVEARRAYMRGLGSQSMDRLRGVAKQGSLPWAHAEAAAFRIEWYLAEGLSAQAQAAVDEVARTPYSRWHVIRLAIAKSRFAQDELKACLKIAESVWVDEAATSRHRARALAIGVACARELGDAANADRLLHDMRYFCRRDGLQEPYDDLPHEAPASRAIAGPRIRPPVPTPLERVALTKRELAVLRALNATGGIDDIAVLSHVSKNTVKTQLRHIYRKLGVHSRDDALRAATDEGLL